MVAPKWSSIKVGLVVRIIVAIVSRGNRGAIVVLLPGVPIIIASPSRREYSEPKMRISLAKISASITQGYVNKVLEDIFMIHTFISTAEQPLTITDGANEVMVVP